MARALPNWLDTFLDHTKWGEAPPWVYFWVGVSTLAATLRRKVWLDMGTFIWYPNLYTLLVAPPGIVAKSTSADLGMSLLREVPGIHFGPATATWQALYDAFSEVGESFFVGDQEYTQFPLVINSSEFGITLNPKDTEMIDQLVHMWDGRPMEKRTRKDGVLSIATPSLNLIACTTPAWIAENVPRYLIGGGLTSRMLFVYADKKARYLAYPYKHLPKDFAQTREKLIRDLEHISTLSGSFRLTPSAESWGEEWYEKFHRVDAPKLDASLVGGYIARKQTLVHKVAMCLSVAAGDSLLIDLPHLQRAEALLTELEKEMPLVYSQIGVSEEANSAKRVVEFIARAGGSAPLVLIYRYMHSAFPDPDAFEKILSGLHHSGQVIIDKTTKTVSLPKG